VEFLPDVTYFKPAGIPLRALEEIRLSVEEIEAIRLKDLESLDQEHGAEKMNISRPTFQRILASGKHKIAEALINGKAIRIGGGSYNIEPVVTDVEDIDDAIKLHLADKLENLMERLH